MGTDSSSPDRTPENTPGLAQDGPREGARTGRGKRCLVLTSPDQAAPPILLEALSRKDIGVSEAADAPSAMVALALAPMDVLVAVAPQPSERMRELGDAVRRYYPGTAVWRFEQRESRAHLGPWRAEPAEAVRELGSEAGSAEAAEALRESLRGLAVPGPPPGGEAWEMGDDAWISQEELAMLLGSDAAPGAGANGEARARSQGAAAEGERWAAEG
ncbi:MAG: hypothetical protein AAGA57_05550 [Planctomycetota bacterium]